MYDFMLDRILLILIIMKISVDHTQSSSCLSLSFSIISSYFDIDARLGGPTARSVVIPLDYRPGTELASLISSSVLAHSFSLILSSYFLCPLSLFTLFTSKLGLSLHPLLRLRTIQSSFLLPFLFTFLQIPFSTVAQSRG